MLTAHLQYAFCTMTLLNRQYGILKEREQPMIIQLSEASKFPKLTTLEMKSWWLYCRSAPHVSAWTSYRKEWWVI